MRRSSDSGQTEPLAALVALAAVCLGVTLYAGVLDGAVRESPETRDVAGTTLDRVHRTVATAGVIDAGGIADATATGLGGPPGWQVNATLRSPSFEWQYGSAPPPEADRASRRVAVDRGNGRIRSGVLRVAVWR
jgi:hypothetical protein